MYKVSIVRTAQKEIEDLPDVVYEPVIAAIKGLANNPRPVGCRKLQGDDDLWRVKVRQYRIVCRINDMEVVVTVVRVAHRGSVYR